MVRTIRSVAYALLWRLSCRSLLSCVREARLERRPFRNCNRSLLRDRPSGGPDCAAGGVDRVDGETSRLNFRKGAARAATSPTATGCASRHLAAVPRYAAPSWPTRTFRGVDGDRSERESCSTPLADSRTLVPVLRGRRASSLPRRPRSSLGPGRGIRMRPDNAEARANVVRYRCRRPIWIRLRP